MKVIQNSGNVYVDLGIENPDEHALEAELARRIDDAMKSADLSQAVTAQRLGISQPDVARLIRGHFRQFSVERLLRFLVALGQDIEIVVRPASKAGDKQLAGITVSTGRQGDSLGDRRRRQPTGRLERAANILAIEE